MIARRRRATSSGLLNIASFSNSVSWKIKNKNGLLCKTNVGEANAPCGSAIPHRQIR